MHGFVIRSSDLRHIAAAAVIGSLLVLPALAQRLPARSTEE